jgi:ATP-dependent RNA helicase DBP3
VYGGADRKAQVQALKAGVDIIVATPGRLVDLLEEKCTRLSEVQYLVLDEADRMLDMGFEKAIRGIVDQTSPNRQTLMFSATWPEIVRKIASTYLKDAVKVTIGSMDLSANRRVKQIVEVVEPKTKDRRLLELLKQYHDGNNKLIIFVLYKKEATRVEEMLKQKGFNVQGLHADKSQFDRTKALDSFKGGKCPLLVATDVAARGLDVPNVEYVINYTFPLTVEEYVHRIGRTGRAGKSGIAHTMFTAFDKSHSGALIQVLREANQEVPADLMKFGTFVKPKEQKFVGSIDINKVSDGHITFDSDSE